MDKMLEDELEKLDYEMDLFWRELDEKDKHTDWNQVQNAQKEAFAEMLKGELGEDIKNVTSGKVKVKLPWKLKIKYWFQNLFKLF